MKLSNNSTFVILILAILKYRSFYISSFQILTPTLVGVQISEDVPVPGEVLVAEGIQVAEDIRVPEKHIRVPEHFRVPEIIRVLDRKKLKLPAHSYKFHRASYQLQNIANFQMKIVSNFM